jgi:tetratricopeptide (TPR) repeat protein
MRELKGGEQLASRYSLVRKLGGSRLTETWLARDRLTRAEVALKIAVDPKLTAAALRLEWETSIRLVHPHIVRVFEFHDDGPFYSLQYIDGVDIGALSGAPLEAVLAPIGLVADALAYAHGKSIVHRDIKPGNVLLDANGAPYLIDFGVAARTAERSSGGSLIAASPQQLDGDPAAPADDVFALGGLIYELVNGRSPYSSAATEADIRSKLPPALADSSGEPVPEAIRTLVARMLAKDAGDRPDATEVADSLRTAGFPPGPAPPRLVGSSAKFREQEVIESGRASRRPALGDRSVDAPVESRRTGLSPRIVAGGLAVLLVLLAGVVFLLPGTVEREPADVTDVADVPPDQEREAAGDDDAADVSGQAEQPPPQRDRRVLDRQAAEEVLGQLLAKTRTLESRAVERWGGLDWRQAKAAYEAGDEAYLARDYTAAAERYTAAIEKVDPLLERVDIVFERTLADAEAALAAGNAEDAVRLFELAVAISPSHGPARAGLARAENLGAVLELTDEALALERDLELEAARKAFERAVEIDPEWQPASAGLERVKAAITRMQFDARMSEGLNALAEGDYLSARAAFRVAQSLKPASPEPADGLLQVDQGIRLQRIAALENEAAALEDGERWEAAVDTYEQILELDPDLAFAKEGLGRARRMSALHAELEELIAAPDTLSAPRAMQVATKLIVDITRMPSIGPRLEAQRDELSRLLKRAATPLTVQLVSDNATDVSIYKVGKLGTFESTEVALKPGTYVAVGSRPGYRDVRLEFRVAPEIDMQPVVVRCEERI